MNSRANNTWKYLLGLVVILGGVGFVLSSSLNTNLTFFITPSEYLADTAKYADKTVRLGGVVQENSVKYNKQTLELRFVITDGTTKFPVSFKGTPPDLFKPGRGVTVEGKFAGNTFQGSQLLVKHSEEYRAPKPGEKLDYDNITKNIKDSR
jgi:cytochrome c-type biogenesis protein CcmE